jgi:hypothetical protein
MPLIEDENTSASIKLFETNESLLPDQKDYKMYIESQRPCSERITGLD